MTSYALVKSAFNKLCFIFLVQSPVFWTSKLTDGEITRISLRGGLDWDSLAGLLDIPYNEQEEIRFNDTKYPTFSLKFEAILRYFNDSNDYDREILKKCFKILQRGDLLREMLPAENKVCNDLQFSSYLPFVSRVQFSQFFMIKSRGILFLLNSM